jgi:phage gpG-like protein
MGVKVVKRPPPCAPLLVGGIPETMSRAAAYLRSSADRKIKSGVPPPNSPLTARVKRGNLTLRDFGTLARSIAPHSGELWADASTPLKQAKILQRGGAIRAKGRGLWIPAGPETRRLMKQYGAGSPGALIKALKAEGYDGFYTPLTRVYCMYKKGKTLKNGSAGKAGKPFALFVVRSSVVIPARPFLHIDQKDEAYLTALVRRGIVQKLRKGRRHDSH